MSTINDKRKELFRTLPQEERDYISRYGWENWEKKEKTRLEAEQEEEREVEETNESLETEKESIKEIIEEMRDVLENSKGNISVEENTKLKKGIELYQFRLSEALQDEKKIRAEYEERLKAFIAKWEKYSEGRASAPIPEGVDKGLFRSIFFFTAKIITEISKMKSDTGLLFSFLKEGDNIKFLTETLTFPLPETKEVIEERIRNLFLKRRKERETQREQKSETTEQKKSAE